MIKGQIYQIPHTCFIAQWSTPDDGGYEIFGQAIKNDEQVLRFDSVIEVKGYRCIELIERVRDHWVVDTWLECSEGDTSKQTKLRTHKYLKQLTRNKLNDWEPTVPYKVGDKIVVNGEECVIARTSNK